MKSLKIALMLVVFCLTVSGSSYDTKSEINDTITKEQIKVSHRLKAKMGVPPIDS